MILLGIVLLIAGFVFKISILWTIGVILVVVGAIAAGQRGYFTHAAQTCSSAGTIAVTVIAGPLNYFSVNPKVTSCNVPKPS